jgi:hypothetical protein
MFLSIMYLGVEFLGHVVTMFSNLLRKCETIFQSSYTIKHAHPAMCEGSKVSHPHQHL